MLHVNMKQGRFKDQMRSWLERAGGEYARRKKLAEKRVVRWEWATWQDRSIEPLYFEMCKFARGKRLPRPPRRIEQGYVAYGLDAEDRVVVERTYSEIVHRGRRRFDETFYEHSEDGLVEWVHFDHSPAKSPIAVGRATFSGERIISAAGRGTGGGSTSRYFYRGDRIVRIETDGLQPDAPRRDRRWSQRFAVRWDERGRLAKITRDSRESRPEIVYERLSRRESLKGLVAALEKELVAQIPKAVAALRLRQPVYSLVLAYGGGGEELPPAVGVGLASERDRWLSAGPEHAKWYLWNPAEYRHYARGPLCMGGKKLLSLCSKVNQEIGLQDKWWLGLSVVHRVAARLRAVPWSSLLPVTDDFVVYAVDFELGDLRDSLRQAAGKQQYARWLRARLVP